MPWYVLVVPIVQVFWTTANLGTQLMLTALHCVAAAVQIPALPPRHTAAIRPPVTIEGVLMQIVIFGANGMTDGC